jgi:peptidyl-tRNA hydrolase, PTH1 family
MLLVVGLGNPGERYAGNRHNVGFMAVAAIAERYGFPAFRQKFQGDFAKGQIDGHDVLLLCPRTYMNLSGQSAEAAASFFKLSCEDMVVIHDDLDLAAGKIKTKKGGGAAGHNGLRSIDAHLGNEYRRIRLGVGHPGDKDLVTAHVLKDFSKDDESWLTPLIAAIAEHFDLIVKDDGPLFMNKVALALKPPCDEDKET